MSKSPTFFLRRAEFPYAYVMPADLGTLKDNLGNLEDTNVAKKGSQFAKQFDATSTDWLR